MNEEHKRKIGLANKGKIRSDETKKRLSESAHLKWEKPGMREAVSEQNKRRNAIPPSRKGVVLSKETRRKMSNARRGEKNHLWKGGISKDKSHYSRERRARKMGASGSTTVHEWEILKAQYNWTCPSCGKKEPLINLTQDHIIPLARGGSNNVENIQPLCKSCNSRKYTKTIKFIPWRNE